MLVQGRTDCAEWLRAELEDRGLTQREVAERVGVTMGTISRWCRGRTAPDPELQVRLQEALQSLDREKATQPRQPPDPGFTTWLRARRRERGLSLAELAASLGLSTVTLQNWSTGRRRPHPASRPGLARALGVTVEEVERIMGLGVGREMA